MKRRRYPHDDMPRYFIRAQCSLFPDVLLPEHADYGYSCQLSRTSEITGFIVSTNSNGSHSICGFDLKSPVAGEEQRLTAHSLTSPAFKKLDRLFQLIDQTAITDRSHWAGHDGEWYDLFVQRAALISLSAWSPEPYSLPGRALDLMRLLSETLLATDGGKIDLSEVDTELDDIIQCFEVLGDQPHPRGRPGRLRV